MNHILLLNKLQEHFFEAILKSKWKLFGNMNGFCFHSLKF